jgi:diguanylate cyclase (GGDEF)-like protein
MRLMPDALDRLRDHARADWNEERAQGIGDNVSTQEILLSHAVEECDREPLYRLELLHLFRQRLRLLAIFGFALIPIFHLFFSYLSPQAAQQALLPHGLMLMVCISYWFFAPRIPNLVWARAMAVWGYVLICASTSLVMAALSQSPLDDVTIRSIQFVVFAAHSQILLSLVILPLSLWESIVLASITAGSLAWSAWWVLPEDAGPARSAQLFVLSTTAIFVLCVAQLQSMLRRRAFDSTFDLARSAVQLEALSTLDAVTGGFNRLYLQNMLTLEVSRAARFSHPLSVMMFDLDNFKAINDTLGHNTGDEVLRIIWQSASTILRDVDTIARYGGDEFVAVLPETEIADVKAIAERLQTTTASQLRARYGESCPCSLVTLSIGIVTLHPVETIPAEHIIALADERLYEAKRMGKNCIAI